MKNILILVVTFAFFTACAQTKQPDVGDTIPMFTLKNQDGKTFNMKDSLGKKMIVIFFYPKDESAVCTKEACTFRDSASLFAQVGAIVVGINQGTVESHKKFQEHYNLPYQLLSDPDETVIKAFGVHGTLLTDRVTFVIDKTGVVVFRYHSMTNGTKHTSEVLQYLREADKK